MALVGDIVARFRAETGDYLQKIDAAKAKNKELATQLVSTAGTADKAIASLTIAKKKGALGDVGLDSRQVSGIISEIKAMDRTAKDAAKGGAASFAALGKEARGYGNVLKSVDAFGSGNFLKGIATLGKGIGQLKNAGGDGFGNSLLGVGLAATVLNVVGKKLAEVTGKAVELKKQFQEGTISAGELTEKLIAELPVLGGIWQTGRNIRDLLGLENHDLEKQIALEKQIYDARAKLIEIDKQLREDAAAWAKDTLAVKDETHATALELAGLSKQAAEFRIKVKADNELDATVDKIKKETEAKLKQINATITPDTKDGVSFTTQLNNAGQSVNNLKAKLAEAKSNLDALKATDTGDSGFAISSAASNVEEAQTALTAATQKYTSLQSLATQATKERKLAEDNQAEAIKAATDASKDSLDIQRQKLLGTDALNNAQAAAANRVADEAILKITVKGDSELGETIAKIKADTKAKLGHINATITPTVDGVAFAGQLNVAGNAVETLESKLAEAQRSFDEVKGDSNSSGEAVAASAAKVTDAQQALAAATATYSELQGRAAQAAKDRKTAEDSQAAAIRAATAASQQATEIERQKLLGSKELSDAQRDAVAKTTAAEQDAGAAGKRIAEAVFTGLKTTLNNSKTATAIVDWFGRQKEVFEQQQKEFTAKANEVRESLKSPAEKLRGEIDVLVNLKSKGFLSQEDLQRELHVKAEPFLEGGKDKASQAIDAFRTTLRDQLRQAVQLRQQGALSNDDIGKFLGRQEKDLNKEQKTIQEDARHVFELPDIKEVRSGSVLFAPPNKIDEQQLQRLTEIRGELKEIKQAAQQNGITIEEIT